jgi:hypothetical protein
MSFNTRVQRTLEMSSSTGYAVDLRPIGDTTDPFARPTKVSVNMQTLTGTPECWIKFESLTDGTAVPSAPGSAPFVSGGGGQTDWIHLKSGTEVTSAQVLARSYNPNSADSAAGAAATHILVWCVAAGYLEIQGE